MDGQTTIKIKLNIKFLKNQIKECEKLEQEIILGIQKMVKEACRPKILIYEYRELYNVRATKSYWMSILKEYEKEFPELLD